MKRLLKAAAALVCAFGFTFAHAQMTAITAAHINMGGVPIAAGTVTFTPVNLSGIPIAFATGGGGLNSPTAFSCTITAGAITGSCSIPDAALTTPANILYAVQITNTSTQKSFTLQQVTNVTGTSWALDQYGPPANTSNVQTVQSSYGTAAPPSSCVNPSFYTRNYSGGLFYQCVAGVFVQISGGSGSSYTFNNGLTNSSGTVSPSYGATANTVTQGNDSRFTANAAAAAAAQATANAAVPSSAIASLATGLMGANNGVGAPRAASATDIVMTKLNTLLGSGTIVAAYLHADCTNPYKDYSGNGYDGATASGYTAPTCTPQGLQYYNNAVATAWSIPTAVSAAALSYATRLCPYTSAVGANNGTNNGVLLESSSTSGLAFTLFGAGTNEGDVYAPAIGTVASSGATSTSQLLLGCSTVIFNLGTNSSTDPDQIFMNGVQPTYASQGASAASRAYGTVNIGAGTAFVNGVYYGMDSGFIAFTRKLTPSEALAVTQILRDYGSSIGIPDVPLSSNSMTPSLVCGIDSITFGQGVTSSYCSSTLLTGLFETVNISKAPGIQGQRMAAASSRIVPIFQPLFAAGAPHNTAVLFGCTNDGGTAACAPAMGSGASQLRRLGWKVIAIPMLDRTGADAGKNTFNAAFRTQCPLFADFCLGDSDPNLYADAASANTTYFQVDGTHPTQAGQALLATYVQNAYNKLYGSTSVTPVTISTSTHTLLANESFSIVTANSVLTLPNCYGYTGRWSVKVNPALTVSIKTANSAQTIDGTDYSSTGLVLAAGSNTNFLVILGTTAAAGCTWAIN